MLIAVVLALIVVRGSCSAPQERGKTTFAVLKLGCRCWALMGVCSGAARIRKHDGHAGDGRAFPR